ncbi:MAG: hypothetical protein SWE60_02400 [Thermodesulfobacteriota bacterium]|nr:hypothetical protein [Thermodesulfobacteriota bacterium]
MKEEERADKIEAPVVVTALSGWPHYAVVMWTSPHSPKWILVSRPADLFDFVNLLEIFIEETQKLLGAGKKSP